MVTETLEIKSLEQLSQALENFKKDTTLASRIRVIQVDEAEDYTIEDGAGPFLSADERAAQAAEDQMKAIGRTARRCAGVTTLIERVIEHGRLESFSWSLDSWNSKNLIRPRNFWDALSKTVNTLKRLDLNFYTHEIHALRQAKINPVPIPFTELEDLTLRLDGGHGDNAKDIDDMLGQIHKLRTLNLFLPGCDLENCRIQGLTYNWNFPSLKVLEIGAYVNDDYAFPAFLSRHPTIEKLKYDVESDTPIRIPATDLPNLQALYMSSFGEEDDVAQQDLISASRPIEHLRVRHAPYCKYADLVVVGPESLRCLEVDARWDEQAVQDSMKELLPKLKGLHEFGVTFQSNNVAQWENGAWLYPDPLDAKALTAAIAFFPKNCALRALRMSDDRAQPLPAEFLECLPDCTPRNLEYIQWGASRISDKKTVLYKVVRTTMEDGKEKMKAVQYDLSSKNEADLGEVDSMPLRHLVYDNYEKDSWTAGSILVHVK